MNDCPRSFVVEARAGDASRGSARVRVVPGSDWFDGHFDGAPVLPGVAHLALGAAFGAFDLERVTGVRAARMRTPVGPGETVDAIWERDVDGSTCTFRLSRSGRPVSAFTLGVGEPAACAVGVDRPAVCRASGASIDVAGLLPHSGLARLLERVSSSDERRLDAIARVPPQHPISQDGAASTCLALEIAAQAAAAHGALGARSNGVGLRAPRGFLVGARDARFARPALPSESDLDVSVTRTGAAPPLRVYRFEVSHERELFADGEISVYVETG